MIDDPSYIAELIVKHYVECLVEEEQIAYEEWLTSDPENARLVEYLLDKDRLREGWEEYRSIDERGSWEVIRARFPELGLEKYEDEQPLLIHKGSFFRNKAATWITLAGLMAMAAVLLWPGRGSKQKHTIAPTAPSVTLPFNAAAPIDLGSCKTGCSVTTPIGANYHLRLPDSSTVDLNADSRIEIDSSYGRNRRVTLRGEAYFEVRHQEGKPFIVRVGPLVTINAVGTVFDVKAYPKDRFIQTKLVLGKLFVSDRAGRPHLLAPHQTLVLDRNGQVRTPPVSDTTDEIPWVQGMFTYNGAPIREILNDLSHWYRVGIVVQGEPKEHFTFSCSRQESLEFILGRLAATKHLHYQRSENKVIVYFDRP